MTTSESHLKTIILTGGGTGGSVTPLLALVSNFRDAGYEVVWMGTHHGLERTMVEEEKISYYGISSGKWRRYASLKNITDFFKILIGFFESLVILHRLKPSLVMTAGGFVSVPIAWAAWILGYPIIVHQQDLKPGLANRLMAPCAAHITVTFSKSLEDYGKKAILTGNPIRQEFKQIKTTPASPEDTSILIMGGGTGSEAINQLVKQELTRLTSLASVTHITGEGKSSESAEANSRYHPSSFLSAQEIAIAMTRATIVITRAGLGTLTELAYLGKASILIPMPHSHQEDNALYVQEEKAAIVLSQVGLTGQRLVEVATDIIDHSDKRQALEQGMSHLMPREANEKVYLVAKEILEKHN